MKNSLASSHIEKYKSESALTQVKSVFDACPPPPRKTSRIRVSAFTLAEVIITLGIIGIIAALTMPTLIAKHQEKQAVTALKKFYSTLSQAYFMAKNEYGTPDNWYGTGTASSFAASEIMGNNITKNMKTVKDCDNTMKCFADKYTKIDGGIPSSFYNGSIDSNQLLKKYITNDGMSIFFYSYGTVPINIAHGFLRESYGAVSVDINGTKGPNIFGRDVFSFVVAKEGVVPAGIQGYDENGKGGFPDSCNKTDCFGNCESCTAWVIYNENMDYLYCDDLSWEGKTKCK